MYETMLESQRSGTALASENLAKTKQVERNFPICLFC